MVTDAVGKHMQWMRDRGLAETYITVRGRRLADVARFIGKPVAEATERDLHRWRSSLRLAPDSIRVQVIHVREFFRWLADHHHRRDNPARRIPMPKPTRHLPRPIDEESLRTALDNAPDPAVRLMLALAGWAGLRACELAGLRWESINTADGWLLVTAASAKGHHERVVQLCPWLTEQIRRYGPQPRGWVFRRRDGRPGPYTPNTISKRMGNCLHALDLAHTPHTLRHRFATELLEGCGNLRIVQEQLGHLNPASTAIYTKIRQSAAAAAVALLPVPEAA